MAAVVSEEANDLIVEIRAINDLVRFTHKLMKAGYEDIVAESMLNLMAKFIAEEGLLQ